jgi:uncharacterized protein YPO0396
VKAADIVYKEVIEGLKKKHTKELRETEAKHTQILDSCDKERDWFQRRLTEKNKTIENLEEKITELKTRLQNSS